MQKIASKFHKQLQNFIYNFKKYFYSVWQITNIYLGKLLNFMYGIFFVVVGMYLFFNMFLCVCVLIICCSKYDLISLSIKILSFFNTDHTNILEI